MFSKFRWMLLLFLILLFLPAETRGQLWSPILNNTRAAPWENFVGIPGGIPSGTYTQCTTAACNTVTSQGTSVTAAQINAAVASASSGQYVLLGCGVFPNATLAGTIKLSTNGVVLRGGGPNCTILKVNGSTNCGFGQTCGVLIGVVGVFDGSASVQPGGSNALALTGTVEGGAGVYPVGATHITVGTIGSDTPKVGTMLFIDQINDQNVTGGIIVGDNSSASTASDWSSGGSNLVGGYIKPTLNNAGGFFFVTTSACTSGTVEPNPWSQTENNTTTESGGTPCVWRNVGTILTLSGNGGAFGRPDNGTTAIKRSQVEVHIITACNGSSTPGTSCGSSTTYTINPGLIANNIRTSQVPGAWWNTNSSYVTNAGLENLTLDNAAGNPAAAAGQDINFENALYGWAKNVRMTCISSSGSPACPRSHVAMNQSFGVVLRDSYMFGSEFGGGAEGYGFEGNEVTGCLIENNIFDQQIAPWIQSGTVGCAFTYNFSWNNITAASTFMQGSYTSHDAGNAFNLFDGNDLNGMFADNQHGGSNTATLFRNIIHGNQPVPFDKSNAGSAQTVPVDADSYNRVHNYVGNVFGILTCSGGTFNGRPADKSSQCTGGTLTGASYHNSYEVSPLTGCANSTAANQTIYQIGWGDGAQCSDPGPTAAAGGNDPELVTSMDRWGNCDMFTGTCRFVNGEVATTGGNFYSALSIPANHTLPASFLYNATPSWWSGAFGTPPFPPIGPDVTGGNLVTAPSGIAYENLARLCYENTAQDFTNYPSTLVIAFDYVNNCAGTGGPPVATLSVSSLSFGSQATNTTSNSQTFTVTNTGSSNLVFSGPWSTTGDFTATTPNCTDTTPLTPSSVCTFTVTFTPCIVGARSGVIAIFDNSGGVPSTQTVTLSGTGTGNNQGTCSKGITIIVH